MSQDRDLAHKMMGDKPDQRLEENKPLRDAVDEIVIHLQVLEASGGISEAALDRAKRGLQKIASQASKDDETRQLVIELLDTMTTHRSDFITPGASEEVERRQNELSVINMLHRLDSEIEALKNAKSINSQQLRLIITKTSELQAAAEERLAQTDAEYNAGAA